MDLLVQYLESLLIVTASLGGLLGVLILTPAPEVSWPVYKRLYVVIGFIVVFIGIPFLIMDSAVMPGYKTYMYFASLIVGNYILIELIYGYYTHKKVNQC